MLKYVSIVFLVALCSCGSDLPEYVAIEYNDLPKTLDFNIHVKPILSDKCFVCHGPDKGSLEAGLQLHSPETAFEELKESPGKFAIVPGSLSKSEVYKRITSKDPKFKMPTPESHLKLSAREIAILTKWIEDGAAYKDHWAFLKPEKLPIPVINGEDLNNPIDNFVLQKLKDEGLSFSKPTDKETLLRRVTFDLTGLPPTIQEMDAYLADTSSDAYEKQIDRLLASPHYGEQMALGWMDIARFADTHGYSIDGYRDMSPWRDWVIKAFNQNMSYEDFVTWQLAGDLLENPTKDMILATGFNRLHPQNGEGGIVGEEFLVEYMVDRAATAGQSLMGLTVACARCHDHKYDPITQKNVYEMASYFNNINEAGQISYNGAMPTPTMLLPTDAEKKVLEFLERDIEKKSSDLNAIENKSNKKFEAWLVNGTYKSQLIKPVTNGLVGSYDLENTRIKNKLSPYQLATLERENNANQTVELVAGHSGKGLLLNGDTWLDLKKVGTFGKEQPFTVGVWAKIPKTVTNGNIFHKGNGAVLYAWRGYHLKIVDNKLEIMMAHTAPDNAIVEISSIDCPKDTWTHFALTYDGSSKAVGLKLYLNGEEVETKVENDNLFKDILFGNRNSEPALQFGARWRGKGIAGGVLDDIKVFNRELNSLELLNLANNPKLNVYTTTGFTELSETKRIELKSFYNKSNNANYVTAISQLKSARKAYIDSAENVKEVMVMKETAPKQAYLLDRGIYDARADSVFPKTPEFLLPMSKDLPNNRLGFAKWLFNKDHPLTSKVAVNRMWQHFFGTGIVKTSEDFGNQSELPSHPALLDYLAIHFMDSNWDIKKLNKLIVMSKTYQQDSKTPESLLVEDPENRLLARGPSGRMTGEMMRDNALAASGLLRDTIGGESVRPYQPFGLWRVNGSEYRQDTGNRLYRRSMYTIWKRSIPNPTLATFDAPARDVCSMRRQETNTPLQALVLLNDPTYIEAARVMGKQMAEIVSPNKAIENIFRKLTGRKPSAEEIGLLMKLQEEEYAKFEGNISKAYGWLNTGEFELEKTDNKALIAANAVVASTILNADATISKR